MKKLVLNRRNCLVLLGLSASAAVAQEAVLPVRGQVFFRERMALPPNAMLEIELLDVARADAPAALLQRFSAKVGSGSPIAFSVHVSPDKIPPKAVPALRAKITVDGQVWFTSTNHIALPKTPATHLEIPLQRVAAAPSLHGVWRAEDILGAGVLDGPPATLEIGEKGQVSGSGGCNRLAGQAVVDGDGINIRFGQMASTMMACAPAAMNQERKFTDALAQVRRFQLIPQESKLLLLDDNGEMLIRLSKDN